MLIKLRWFFILALAYSAAQAQNYNPIADSNAVVVQGNARFTVLSDNLIRMEYAPDGAFNDNATLTFVNRNLPVPDYTVKHENGWIEINTVYLHLKYKENSGSFNTHNLSVTYNFEPIAHHETACDVEMDVGTLDMFPGFKPFTWKPGMKDKKNLKGTTRTLDAALGKFSFGQMKKLPIEDGIISRSGWAFIDDSQRPLFDNSDWPWVEPRKNNGAQDWYFFGYGYNYKWALNDFVSTSGRISMPPKYAFGIWYSRYWRYTEQDMKDIVSGYAKNDIPLDVLVVDMDWHLTENSEPELFKNFTPKLNGWTGFTWEKKYFPDYKEFLKWTDKQQLQTCLNIHPAAGVQAHEAAYPAFAKAMNFDTNGRKPIPFDITNKKFAKAYFDVLLHPYEKDGVDFWWLDWQQWGGTNIKGVNPTFYLNYVHYSDMQRQGKRPLIFHRYGGLGNQRYQIGFSGDCIIDWKSLSYQPEFTATAANVGFGYWSHDIGGHMNPVSKANKQNAELFTRWVQWGAFSPIFRTHATQDPEIERRIWMYPDENFKAMRKAMQMRYALLPYIYNNARKAYDEGISLVRPMYYDHPVEPVAYQLPHQYYFGDDMIVAPVHESMKDAKTIEQKIWLPPNSTWYDYRSNKMIKGKGFITANYAIDEIPVFVKAGSIIPTQTAKTRITGSVMDTLILTFYPAIPDTLLAESEQTGFATDTDFVQYLRYSKLNLYEDDGVTEGYKRDSFSITTFIYKETKTARAFTISPDGKHYTGQPAERSYEIRIVNYDKPKHIAINGKEAPENTAWNYDKPNNILTIKTAKEKIADMRIDLY